jgi:prepilin signal peptidase PulO-like enzyme (type II secretory pathway)
MPDLNLVPPVFGYVVAGVFGAIIGSFLNVVIHRVPLEESIVFPNSRCPSCGAVIAFYDNIPGPQLRDAGSEMPAAAKSTFRFVIPQLSC